jgi:hypothetical protein
MFTTTLRTLDEDGLDAAWAVAWSAVVGTGGGVEDVTPMARDAFFPEREWQRERFREVCEQGGYPTLEEICSIL